MTYLRVRRTEMTSGPLAAPCTKCFQELLPLKMPVSGSFFRELLQGTSDFQITFRMKREISLIVYWYVMIICTI